MNEPTFAMPTNLFVASTLGQIDNAIEIIDQRKISDVAFLLLGSSSNLKLLMRMEDKCRENLYPSKSLKLPVRLYRNLPHKIFITIRRYKHYFNGFIPKVLWLSNFNGHYSFIARYCYSRGSKIIYYEEGLGTYKGIDSYSFSNYVPQYTGEHLIKRWLRKFAKKSLNSILYQKFLKLILGEVFLRTDTYCNFDLAIVSFPEYLINTPINAITVEGFDKSKSFQTTPEIRKRLLDTKCDNLLICQDYGIDLSFWTQSVAVALSKYNVREVIIKIHPREKDKAIAVWLNSLTQVGINPICDLEINSTSAEKIIGSGSFKRVFGITSSSLIYGKRYFPQPDFISIGDEVEMALKQKNLSSIQLREDLLLFKSLFV